MASSSMVSPLCTWLVAACMSVTCGKDQSQSSFLRSSAFASSSKRHGRWARTRRRALLSQCSGRGNGSAKNQDGSMISAFYGFGIQGLMASWLTFEPCPLQKPPTNQRRVVVTGIGVVTPLGHDLDVFYNKLLEGASGISEIETFDCAQFPTRIAGEIKFVSADGWVAPKLSKRMDKFMLYMLIAGKKALKDGGVTEDVMDELDKAKCGVLIGSAMGGIQVFNDAIEALRISYKKMNHFCVPFATTNMGSAMLAMDLGWMGPNYSISTACATSNFCILNAANHIISGEADMMLCGGSDAAIIPIDTGASGPRVGSQPPLKATTSSAMKRYDHKNLSNIQVPPRRMRSVIKAVLQNSSNEPALDKLCGSPIQEDAEPDMSLVSRGVCAVELWTIGWRAPSGVVGDCLSVRTRGSTNLILSYAVPRPCVNRRAQLAGIGNLDCLGVCVSGDDWVSSGPGQSEKTWVKRWIEGELQARWDLLLRTVAVGGKVVCCKEVTVVVKASQTGVLSVPYRRRSKLTMKNTKMLRQKGRIKKGIENSVQLREEERWIFIAACAWHRLGGFVACRTLSQRNNDPTKASRPWDIVIFQ
ncbi:hypothetical protein GOBAR_AA20448 [Gossypium barbadense]|uniref:beta-ketoacyl-[acyl-carrier-protein] synthase I n=1 Tax=Gossypium barbadense TaxID=3634 RepID=A0A2P5XA67_GOSBA|nr:hypothetical protein GOBAR_AA20448 [Gossypium barbadense]